MKIERRAGADERTILIGMIVDPVVLGRVAPRWGPEGLCASRYANLVGGWCVRYMNRYGTAPGKSILGMFEHWASKSTADKDNMAMVERFLTTLSEEYEALAKESNSQYVLDVADRYFTTVRLRQLAEAMQGDIDNGDIEGAKKRMSLSTPVDLAAGSAVDVFQDMGAIQQAFESSSEVLVQYPGACGEMMGNALERDGFVAFLAPEKRGKSWWLMDVAWRGMMQRRKVAIFQAGDMSQNQVMRRLMTRAAGRPLKAKKYLYPTDILRDEGENHATARHEDRETTDAMSWKDAYNKCQAIMERKVKTKESLMKLSTHAAGTLSVAGIRANLQGWEREGWVPDVVVVDYADLLAAPGGYEGRDAINQTWLQLRGVSQTYHNLLVTATQADAASYTADTLGRWHFSEDKRKLAHVTAMLGINQSDEEKEQGVSRLNWLVLREDDFVSTRCVHLAGCLSVGNPMIQSCW